MSMKGPKRFLPMAWRVERVSPTEVYTFRWGRGSGVVTVHRGDIGSSHDNDQLIDTVHIGSDWADESDVATQARLWLRSRIGPRRRSA
ncbi:hypothetical protein BJ970_000830 [Saccharopolyspora phatthalungensis]|uniref:Uncharacterized protein n=1 Tax=Saccharopolyspora phatthalungensis TaxID=664693 RepID=A0A840PYC1_9PSEU|nr:hypothetical protein [Saccharopolyspora phatthalungensis]